jgi:hypothetical protein
MAYDRQDRTMSHFSDTYATSINDTLHAALRSTWFYRQEIYQVSGVATALLVTYDNVYDDQREYHLKATWEQFVSRMAGVKPDWADFSKDVMVRFAGVPDKTMLGWEGRTIYFIKGGENPQFWTPETAAVDVRVLLDGTSRLWGEIIQQEIDNVRDLIPVGREKFADYERFVRILFTFLFRQHLGEGRLQVRTESGDEGCEVRDLICANHSERGFWKDLKDKYSCSEIIVDAKNKDELTRDDLRQLYCYLKPAVGFWGFVVCRSSQPDWVHAYNRTLFKNFTQSRGLMILSDEDFRRMVSIARRGHDASDYLQERKSEFVRSV